jgi:uncharacterized protein YciI
LTFLSPISNPPFFVLLAFALVDLHSHRYAWCRRLLNTRVCLDLPGGLVRGKVWLMYAIALLRYRKPIEEVLKVLDAHRSFLEKLKEQGYLLASGPLEPRTGGALLLRVPDADYASVLDKIRDDDPFTSAGVAQYELLPWVPNVGISGLNSL